MVNRIYTLIVALLPVLATYASGIPGFSIADVCLALFWFIALMCKSRSENCYSISINSLKVGLILIVTFSSFACIASYPLSVADVLIRTIRYAFYVSVAIYSSKKLLNIRLLSKYVKTIAVLASLFIMFQFFMFHTFNIVIKGFISSVPLYTSSYATFDYASLYRVNLYRPTSFFLEPAHYARYSIIAIVLLLIEDKSISNISIGRAVLCTIGIILSTSSQGYLLLSIIISVFMFTRVHLIKSAFFRLLVIMFIFLSPVILYCLLNNPIISATIRRSLGGDISTNTSAMGARLGGFLVYVKLPFLQRIFGTGFGNVPDGVWLSSAAYWLYGAGLIVFIVYLFFLVSSFLRLKGAPKYVLLVFLLLFFTDDSFYSYMCVIFISLIIYKEQDVNADERINHNN